jgi:hypothetical protein
MSAHHDWADKDGGEEGEADEALGRMLARPKDKPMRGKILSVSEVKNMALAGGVDALRLSHEALRAELAEELAHGDVLLRACVELINTRSFMALTEEQAVALRAIDVAVKAHPGAMVPANQDAVRRSAGKVGG